jgi:uncharacterized Fe-S radical SAM superfamily protein PflX
VRILVLPGHGQCCHQPVLAVLAGLSGVGNLYLSVQATYLPEWKVMSANAPLSRRPSPEEVASVHHRARDLGLTVIE